MAKTISSFYFFALFLSIVLLGNGPSVTAARTVEKRMMQQQITWCVAKQGLSDAKLQGAIDYFCNKVDCSLIQSGASCFEPNTKYDHASFSINMFFHGNHVCPSDVGQTTATDPSHGSCTYVSVSS